LQLAAQAQQAGQQNVAFGTGLFGTGSQLLGQYQAGQVGALSPFQTYLGTGQSIEEMGQQPLTLGAGLGGQAAAYGANAGRSLLAGGLSAAETQQRGSSYSPLGGLLQGAARDPRLQTGFEKIYNDYTMNRNIEGALPQTANPFYSGASPSEMQRIMGEYY